MIVLCSIQWLYGLRKQWLIALGLLLCLWPMHSHAQDEGIETQFFKKPKVKVGIRVEPPFIMKDTNSDHYDKSDDKNDGFYGLSIDLWKDIAEKLDIEYEYEIYPDVLPLINDLSRGKIQLSIAPLHVSAIRAAAFDVTQPFFISSVGVAVSKTNRDGMLANLFSLDVIQILAYLVLVIASIGIVMWFVERRRNTIEFAEDINQGVVDGIWWAAVTMTTVGYGDKIPKTRTGKLVALVWMFTSIILISSLTASITSELSRNQNGLKIENVKDLEAVEAKVGTVAYSSSSDYLEAHGVDVPKRYCFSTPLEGLKALQKGEISVFVYDKPIMYYLLAENSLDDDIDIMPVTFNKNYCSFMINRNQSKQFPETTLRKLNPELIERITKSSWALNLRTYSLD